jgi:hypothetical protein
MGRWLLALLASLGLGLGVTGPKLYKMAQIKGWVPGALVTPAVVTQKGVDPRQFRQIEETYWVSWEYGEVRGSWTRRVRVSPEVWEGMKLGDPIDLIRVPGDGRTYLRNGVFVDWGNCAFDLFLLAAAVVVALVSAVRLLWWLVRGRAVQQTGMLV